MSEMLIMLSEILLVVVGSILIAVSFIIPMPQIYIFVVSLGGGMLVGTGLINLYLDWRLRQKWNKRLGD